MTPGAVLISGIKLITIALLYAISGRLGQELDAVAANIRVFLPQSGVALAFLTLWGARYFPGVILGSVLFTLTNPVPVPYNEVFALAFANAGAIALGAYLLRRSHFDPTFGTIRDLYKFLFYGLLVTPLVNAFAAPTLVWITNPSQWNVEFPVLVRRWFGHGISHLLVTPVILTWSRRWTTSWPKHRRLELVLLVSLLLLISVHAFTGQSAVRNLNYPLSFAPFPFVIWAGLRFGPRGATSATFLLGAVAIYGTSNGYGPFSRGERGTGLMILQVYLTAMAVSGLFLAAAVAERRTTMQQLTSSREQLRALSQRLQHTREEERALLSREIHDELGQQLTSLKIGLKGIRKRLTEGAGIAPDLLTRLDRLSESTDEAVQAVRRIASDLRPGMLDDLGLVPSLEWLVRQFRERTGIPASFKSSAPKLEVGEDLSIAVFRIVQESLTNIARHANATNVQVHIWTKDKSLVLEVRDDGIGMPRADTSPTRRSLGIVGMQERAHILEGVLEVISPVEESAGESASIRPGTLIRATLPTNGVPT